MSVDIPSKFVTTVWCAVAITIVALNWSSHSSVLADIPQSAQGRQQQPSSSYTSTGSGFGGQYSGYGGGGPNPQLPLQLQVQPASNPGYMGMNGGQDQWSRQYDIQQRYGQQGANAAGQQIYNPYNPYSNNPQQQPYRGGQSGGSGTYPSNTPFQQQYPQAGGSGPFGGFNAQPNPLDPRYAQQDMRSMPGGQQRGLYYNSATAIGSLSLTSLVLSTALTLAAAMSLGHVTR